MRSKFGNEEMYEWLIEEIGKREQVIVLAVNSHCFAIDCVRRLWSDPDLRVVGPGVLNEGG